MRFTTAWANVMAQNLNLRTALVTVSLTAVTFLVTTVRLALRQPLVIERECFSKVAVTAGTKHSPSEIEAFVGLALPHRFDSGNQERHFLSDEESTFRQKEQEELTGKQITQKLIVNSVKIEDGQAMVDSDRLLSVGKVKSVLAFPLVVKLGTVQRSSENPYGLVLERVSQPKQEVSSK